MPFLIREMTPEDISDVKMLEVECSLSPWQTEDYEFEVRRENSVCLVALGEDLIVGFLVARLIMNQKTFDINNGFINLHTESMGEAEIYNIAISVNHRKKGIGAKLLNTFLQFCRKSNIQSVFLEVRESNEAAIKFYLNNNFQIVGKRNNFYILPTENALVMKSLLRNTRS